jgi:hypothetical protein
MSALMDQVYESAAGSPPSAVARLPPPADSAPASPLETSLIVVVSLAMAGAVFGFALERFGWAGLLIATWPAFALAGGFGCLCQDLLQRASRRVRRPRRADAA